jgi:hypothetical protein
MPLRLRKRRNTVRTTACILAHLLVGCAPTVEDAGGAKPRAGAEGVRPYAENPYYLAWDGVPIFPLGATGHHAWTPISRPTEVDIEAQLDRLAAVIDGIGSRHVRGFVRALPYDPMNHMHDGTVGRVLQPWMRLEDGRFDLERFDPEWGERLREYLDAALARRIVVSLELWDDWSLTRGAGGEWDPGPEGAWNAHPFNPKNNVNFSEGLLSVTTAACGAPFYETVSGSPAAEPILRVQQLYADHLLDIAADYANVLVNLSNESRAPLGWSRFWAEHVRERLDAGMLIGDMPSTNRRDGRGECDPELNPMTLATDPRYGYVDVAQAVSRHEFPGPDVRNQVLGGGRRLHAYRLAMAEAATPRPLIVSKDYTLGPAGGDMVLWSRFVGGAAAARFHRPNREDGQDVVDFQHEAVGRLGRFIADVPFWRMHPAPALLRSLPAGSGANVLAEPGGHVVVQLLGGAAGERIALDLPPGRWLGRWVDPARGEELEQLDIGAREAQLGLAMPVELEHLILHLRPAGR